MPTKPFIRLAGLLLFASAIIAGIAPAYSQSPQRNPFSGKWKANLEKSQRHPNHQFSRLTMIFEIAPGDTVLVTYAGVNMSGKDEGGTRKLRVDGKEYSVPGAPGVVEVSKWLGANTLQTVAKKDGQIVGESSYEVSNDGTTLTARVKGIDANGKEFEQVIVFDRLPL